MKCFLLVSDEFLFIFGQMKEFKYLGAIFTSEDRMEWDMTHLNEDSSDSSAVMRVLVQSVIAITIMSKGKVLEFLINLLSKIRRRPRCVPRQVFWACHTGKGSLGQTWNLLDE